LKIVYNVLDKFLWEKYFRYCFSTTLAKTLTAYINKIHVNECSAMIESTTGKQFSNLLFGMSCSF